MAHQGGYAVVDADDDELAHGGHGLEFKTFLATDGPSSQAAGPQQRSADAPYNPFNIAYYQTYFDVDTSTVLQRVGLSMVPRPGFLAQVCDGQVDLYGPFWTLTTLILVLYATSTLTSSISQYLANPASKPASNLPLLSTATTVIYLYGLGVPSLLWGATTWLGVAEWSVVEALGIYGYAMSVYVPVSLLCLIPVGILRWILVSLAAGTSGYFIVRNIYPILASTDNKTPRLLVVAIVVLHAALALTMKILFFSYSVGGYNVGPDPIANPIGDDTTVDPGVDARSL